MSFSAWQAKISTEFPCLNSISIKNVGRTPALNVEIKIINNKTGKILNPIGNHKFNHKFSVIPANDKVELSYPIEYLLEPEYLFEQFSDKIK